MIDICERRPWTGDKILLLIGPGGAGKSSLGLELGPRLKRRLVDLDQEFIRRIGDIGIFIRDEGYELYKLRNSLLAAELAAEASAPMVLVTSSGFLTPDNPRSALEANQSLLARCYSVCLLPSRDTEQAVGIIVERQLSRAFSRGRSREAAIIRDRYPIYARLGDIVVFSTASPGDTARAMIRHFPAER